MKVTGINISVHFFKAILVCAGVLLVFLIIYDHKAEVSVKSLKDRYDQIEIIRNDIMHFDEVLTMSARMAAATGDIKWEERYQEYEPKLTSAIQKAISVSPEIYRKETDRSNLRKIKLLDMEHKAFELIRHGQGRAAMDILFGKEYEVQENRYTNAIERLNTLLKQQMQAALAVEHSKEYLAQVSFITVLCLLLLSWLIILRISRRAHEELVESHRLLSERTGQLDELNQTLEMKVLGRTHHLTRTLAYLQTTHQALKDTQSQLLQSEKFSAIGQLSAGVAHEINNPIGFINSNLQTLQQYVVHYKQLLGILNQLEKALKDKDQERVAQVVNSWERIRLETNFSFIDGDVSSLLKESIEGAQKIGRIVSDLRTFASPDKGVMDAVNLELLLESILNIVWNEIKYKGEIKREFGLVPMVHCNPQKISQVFVNLLINAAQAIKKKGIITVKTYTRDHFVCVDITDTGCGIPSEHFNKIFDPFFTTKSPGEGVGLGLSMSYDIIRKHSGDLTFHSTLDEGTTFTVTLPLEEKL
jgi:signal transduction histidine kinase